MNIESQHLFNNVDRKLAILAALPLFLFGLLIFSITIFLLAIGGPSQILNIARTSVWHNSAIFVGAISLFVLVYAAILTIKNRLASWSYTWLGAILTGYIISLILVGEDRDFMISKTIDITVLTLSLISCLIILCYVALKGWQHSGLIRIGFCGILGLSLLFFGVAGFFKSYLGLISVILGFLEAIVVYIFLRRNSNIIRIILIIGLGFTNIGVSWIIEAIFRSTHPSRDIGQFWALSHNYNF